MTEDSEAETEAISAHEPFVESLFVVVRLRTDSGEILPIVVSKSTGIPPTVALRFCLRERKNGGAARITRIMRRIADLYSWYRQVRGVDFEDELINPRPLLAVDAVCALNDLELSKKMKRLSRPRLRNQRIHAWCTFLNFICRPELWKTGLSVREGYELSDARKAYRDEIIANLLVETENVPVGNHHQPLSIEELRAIEQVLEPTHPLCPFNRASLPRNTGMVHLGRFGGFRIGELLKLTVPSGDRPESFADRLLRELVGGARSMTLSRLPDDERDPRAYPPSVKRHGRTVDLPDVVTDEVAKYIRDTSNSERSPYIFLTTRGDKPLSLSRSEKIIKALGKAASEWLHSTEPNSANSLENLTWHRLRATRAIELLPVFFKDLVWDPISEQEYLAFFGWARREYAMPYLETLHIAEGRRKIRNLRAPSTSSEMPAV